MLVSYDVLHFCNVKAPGRYPMPPTKIWYYDLSFVKSGTMTYTANGKRLVLKPGDVLLLPPGTVRGREVVGEPVHFISFNFTTNEKLDLPFLSEGVADQEIYSLFKAFTARLLSEDPYGQEKASFIVGYILTVLKQHQQKVATNPHVQRVFDYVSLHIAERITLTDVAADLRLTREYTATLFKRETGMTVSAYVNREKLMRARDMLRDGERNALSISQALGYKDYPYFCRLFKEQFGTSPSRFEK